MKKWIDRLLRSGMIFGIFFYLESSHAFSSKKPAEVSPPPAQESAKQEEPALSSERQERQDAVWITKADGSKSCEKDSGQSTEQGGEELKKAQVKILESKKGSDGKMRVQMCGVPSGSVNAYKILKADLPKAIALGFKESSKNP